MLAEQTDINLTIATPLGKDKLILDRMEAIEQISEPFCFSLEMHSTDPALDLSSLVGKEVQITYKYGKSKRYFCGVVGTAEQGWTVEEGTNNFTFYKAQVYPKFWMLKFTRDYRIFQNQSAMDIINAVLKENSVTEIQDKTSSCGKGKREYCVQYGESCFDFISRLMEEEGIFYYFTHTSSTHSMVIADDSSTAKPTDPDTVNFTKSFGNNADFNFVHTLRSQEQVVSKEFATADYNFITPKTKLYSTVTGEGAGGKVYRYPGLYTQSSDGDKIANHRIQDLEWAKITLRGFSTTPSFCPMSNFTMAEHPRESLNATYTLYRICHRIKQSATDDEKLYENEFISFPSDISFRPPLNTTKPLIHSTQTATVTVKSGEEIWCDEYGRIKVQFPWDQRGKNDENSSCWIRVAQLWAGKSWGGVFTPRIGMEVVVTFLDGDPDRPLITGCVYNGENTNPYAKTAPTQSTIKSNTSKGGGGFNEFRFEDKKESEEIYLHAQKDWNSVVEHSRTLLIKTGDDTSTITQGDRTVTLKGEKGDDPQRGNDKLILEGKDGCRTVQIKGDGGNHTLEITKGNSTIHLIEGNESVTLDKGDQTIKIVGKRDLTVNKAESHTSEDTFTHTITKAETHTNKDEYTQSVSKDYTLKVTGNLTIDVKGNITLKSAGNMDVKATGNLTMEGMMVKITGKTGATIDGGPNLTVKGIMANLQGTGMASVKGGMVKIN